MKRLSKQTRHARMIWYGIDIEPPEYPTSKFFKFKDYLSFPGRALTGNTSFFRHKDCYPAIIEEAYKLRRFTKDYPVTLLNAGSSVGMEAYTLAYMARRRDPDNWLRILTLDLSPHFTAIAFEGVYPKRAGNFLEDHISKDEELFEPYGDEHIRVRKIFRSAVKPLMPRSLLSIHKAGIEVDISMSFSTLMYMDGSSKDKVFRNLARISRYAFITDKTPYYDVEGFEASFTRHNFFHREILPAKGPHSRI